MSILISLVFDNKWEINSVQNEYKYVVFQKTRYSMTAHCVKLATIDKHTLYHGMKRIKWHHLGEKNIADVDVYLKLVGSSPEGLVGRYCIPWI